MLVERLALQVEALELLVRVMGVMDQTLYLVQLHLQVVVEVLLEIHATA